MGSWGYKSDGGENQYRCSPPHDSYHFVLQQNSHSYHFPIRPQTQTQPQTPQVFIYSKISNHLGDLISQMPNQNRRANLRAQNPRPRNPRPQNLREPTEPTPTEPTPTEPPHKPPRKPQESGRKMGSKWYVQLGSWSVIFGTSTYGDRLADK